ncbi:hypothetical protein [Clostridium sp.]|jgi:chromosome segregation ATPase|uniref:hypothetical protein n=1 Tax=Clostridium sp. TaxID=1506 RepID=UPI003EEDABFE
MSGRISGLKNKIATLRITIIALEMTPNNKKITSLDNQILGLKQEGQCKQITIDSLEFDVSKGEKRIKNADEIIISLDKEIELLKTRERCNKEDIVYLIDKLNTTSRKLKESDESIVILNANIKSSFDKKIKNKIKKLFVG